MKSAVPSVRVMVSTDNSDDAQQILRQLNPEFEHLMASTRDERMVEDFETFKPQVLVLAFDSLDKAQRYYLGLYRTGQSVHDHPHRTVILCNKDEVRIAFDLCKKQYFDDYVLYWPHTHDGPRLAMTIWSACREMAGSRSASISNSELRAHSRQLDNLEQFLDRRLADGEHHVAHAASVLSQAERDIVGAIDHFAHRLESGASGARVELRTRGR